jgi:murein L,D-transpeptidase YcbB/YkuD
MDFAQFLIRDDSIKYPLDSLISDISKERQKYVYIKKPIALYFTYYTAEVDPLGELHYFIDVYRRDEKMLKAMKRKN